MGEDGPTWNPHQEQWETMGIHTVGNQQVRVHGGASWETSRSECVEAQSRHVWLSPTAALLPTPFPPEKPGSHCPVSSNPSSKEAHQSDTCMTVCALHLRHRHRRGCPPGQGTRAPVLPPSRTLLFSHKGQDEFERQPAGEAKTEAYFQFGNLARARRARDRDAHLQGTLRSPIGGPRRVGEDTALSGGT